jgi:hypothetical protein
MKATRTMKQMRGDRLSPLWIKGRRDMSIIYMNDIWGDALLPLLGMDRGL